MEKPMLCIPHTWYDCLLENPKESTDKLWTLLWLYSKFYGLISSIYKTQPITFCKLT